MKTLRIKLVGAALFFASTSSFAGSTYLAVSGIPQSKSLVVHASPSSSSQAVSQIPHDAVNIASTGSNIVKENKQWLQVVYQNTTGWADASYLVQMQSDSAERIDVTPQTSEILNQPQQASSESHQTQELNIPWTAEQDTIYHDPSAKKLPDEKQDRERTDLRHENLAGDRYENIEISSTTQL